MNMPTKNCRDNILVDLWRPFHVHHKLLGYNYYLVCLKRPNLD